MLPSTEVAPDFDAVIVGGGFGGLYAVHRLRNVLGLNVQAFEAGSGPGGTWYWNRYPGARCDIESYLYSYSFDEDLQREWRWSERFATQPEILAYLNHVADRFDLLKSFEFDTRVTSGVWDDDAKLWTVTTDTGRTVTARFLIGASGGLSQAKNDDIPGIGSFAGEVYHTSSWPESVDLTGKRVAVIGTGSTGIQIIPEIAKVASHLTVFQRTPNFACPLGNRPTTDEDWAEIQANYPAIREQAWNHIGGLANPQPLPSALAVDEKTRREVYDKFYPLGGFRMTMSTFGDLMIDKAANDTAADYIREKIRERVKDPEVARILTPGDDHPYGTKRAPFETNYYETFNRENVTIVDVKATPIETMTPAGLKTAAADYAFDVLILATGFDALTGSLIALNLVGRDGVPLSEAWADGPRSYLGLTVPGFPNFFTIVGPQSPSVLSNFPISIEEHINWVSDTITAVREQGARSIEAHPDSAELWTEMVRGVAEGTLFPQAKSSWYMGANIPGKPRRVLLFLGGIPLYRAMCAEVAAEHYGGFTIDGVTAPLPPLMELDPSMAGVVGAIMGGDPRRPEDLPLDELRAILGAGLPRASDPPVTATDVTYPGAAGELPARVYAPSAPSEQPRPVLVFFHGGGWIGGSLEAVDGPCRTLAAELDAVVISPTYRLAPEHPFPAAIEDAIAALRWAAEAAPGFGGDPSRLAVGGESAGGTMAAILAQQARDAGGPALSAVAMVYSPIDPAARTASRSRYHNGPILTVGLLERMWTTYLGDRIDEGSPLADPSKATSLEGLPPTLAVTVGLDPSRDEAEDYIRALADAGVEAETVRVAGLTHASFPMGIYVPRASEIMDAVVSFLSARWSTPAPEATTVREGASA
ncbi:MAG TPA: alpha/beta hydrolase fold domain-containing protein [Pseudolysinimonas sp.]|nr:alpha/beta hydrolase fold domain-containing protein [Pseudolysinimonas sp.]